MFQPREIHGVCSFGVLPIYCENEGLSHSTDNPVCYTECEEQAEGYTGSEKELPPIRET